MNSLDTIARIAEVGLALVAMIALFWRPSEKRVVSFEGTPVDKREFEKAMETTHHERSLVRQEMQRLTRDVSGLQTATDWANQRIVQMDGKLDRLIERRNS